MSNENLFQIFSQVFIKSQQAFNKTDVELRSKCRTLAEKLNRLVEELENDAFSANISALETLEEDSLQIIRNCADLERRRTNISDSVEKLRKSTNQKITRGFQ